MQKALRKGVPPLFVDLLPLYSDPGKFAIIEELIQRWMKNLRENSTFDGKLKEPATTLLWLMYYVVQHYDYKQEFGKALELVDEAIAHTPTLIELFLLKAKIYKVRCE